MAVKIKDLSRIVSEILDEYSGNIAEATNKTVQRLLRPLKRKFRRAHPSAPANTAQAGRSGRRTNGFAAVPSSTTGRAISLRTCSKRDT